MPVLDFHSFKYPIHPGRKVNISSGYGLAFQDLFDAVVKKLPEVETDITLARNPYTGGDIQVFFGSVWKDQSIHFKRKSDIHVVFTMFEFDRLPDDWIDNLSKFDAVIVPSEYCRKTFKDNLLRNSLDIPVYVCPLGIVSDDWKYIPRDRNGDGKFRILWQGTYYGDRKGGEFAVRAFQELDLPGAELILKCNPRYTKHRTEWDLTHKLPKNMKAFEQGTDMRLWPKFVRSVGRVYTQKEQLALLGSVDLSVNPSTGEGFGLIPCEHMATGLPTILSLNTGLMDFCNSEVNMPVGCTAIMSYYGPDTGTGWEPSVETIKGYITECYNNREWAKEMGTAGSNWIHENFSYDNAALKFINVVTEILDGSKSQRNCIPEKAVG